ncbi:MAG: prepilin-type N-terminal cleavage/methylation domain-containing protein [Eubacteriales bacterium]|nr:prepilin-type N-terminal cleavage/methylation domain-containing protein [Eubacteriales bacterium]
MVKFNEIMKTKINRKGFTLAELLVVVAILAILVAVSIPVFTGKLTKAREATDAANLRAARAVAVTEVLQNDKVAGTYYYDADKGVLNTDKTGITAYSKQVDGKIVEVTITAGGASVETSWVAAAAAAATES